MPGATKTRLVFLYRWSRRKMGSSVMRVDQLARHMQRYFGDTYEVVLRPVKRRGAWNRAVLAAEPSGSVYIFTKFAAENFDAGHMAAFRRKARAILIDYVDMELRDIRPEHVDLHIASSQAFARRLREKLSAKAQIATVFHNVDTALDGVQARPRNDLALCYLGSAVQMHLTEDAARHVTVLDATTPESFLASIPRLAEFNAHFCVRKPDPDPDGRIPPFTKGFTAAACTAAILVNRGTPDAVELLGEDYPFLIDGIDTTSIIEGILRMRDAVGGPTWDLAMQRVRDLRALTSHEAIADQLHRAISQVA